MQDVADFATMREELRTLIDHIPDTDVPEARKILRALMDPFELMLLSAPPDDEPLTEHERMATEEALRREELGEPLISHEEVLRAFGLSESDL